MNRPASAAEAGDAPRIHTHRRRRWVWGSIAIALVVVVGALHDVGGAPPAAELRIGIPRSAESLDPILPGTGLGLVSRAVFQGLVEIGERGDIEPGLASQWAVSRDGLTWTFRVRSDVQFHNGAPLTVDVVVGALARHFGLEEPGTRPPVSLRTRLLGGQAVVREVRRGEAGSVQIQLTQPFSPLLAVLAHPALAIALTPGDSAAPLGTGPYRVADRSSGRITLEATAAARGESLRSARVIIEEFADDAAAVAELGPAGRLHVYFPQSPPAWSGLGLQTLSAPTWQLGWLALRAREGGLITRKPVRQAIALALDPALVGPALGRRARPWASYLPPGAWALRELPALPHEPIRARRVLAEARVQQGTLALLAPEGWSGPDPARLIEAIRLSLAVAGLTLRIRQLADDAYLQALRDGDGDLVLFESTVELDDPHFVLRPLVASEFAVRGSARNVAFYRNPLVDGALLRGSQLGFRPERQRLYQRLQTQLAEELPYIPLYVRQQWAMARPGVRGLRLDPTGRHRVDRVWLEPPPEPAPPPAPTTVPPPPPVLPAPSLSPPAESSP